jgi:hypothetical protein
MILHRVLEVPLPFVVAAVLQAPEVIPGAAPVLVPEGPAWFLGLLSGVWLVVYVLDRFGKLPNKGGGRTDQQVTHLHKLLATEDEDGRPRVLRHFEDTKRLESLMERQVEISEEQVRQGRDHHNLVGYVTDSLKSLHQKVDETRRRA